MDPAQRRGACSLWIADARSPEQAKQIGARVRAQLRKHVGLVELHRARDVDLVLVDWNMPIMGGFELLQQIRARPERDHTCVLMATREKLITLGFAA